jgi:hypothetical protein
MLYKIPALIVHQSPQEAPDSLFLQLVVTRDGCLGSKLLVNVLSMEPMRAPVWSAR